jgi:putative ABC transport system substrate-binding protein
MGISVDPVGQRYVASLARPGGNTTGLATSLEDTTPKQLQFLTMAVPSLTRVGVFVNPDAPAHFEILNILRAAVPPGRLSIVPAEMRNPLDIEGAFAKLMNERIGGVLLPSDSFSFRSASGSRNLP